MAYLFTIGSSALIGGILYRLASEGIDYYTKEQSYDNRIQTNFTLQFVTGLTVLSLVQIFRNNITTDGVRYGLYLGSTLLILDSIFINWNVLEKDTRVLLMAIAFVVTIAFTYYYQPTTGTLTSDSNIKKKKYIK